MSNRRRIERLLRLRLREAGRQYAEARTAYEEGRAAEGGALPRDEDGKVRLVCRRYAERRAVDLDSMERPECFDPESQDCRGCVEDVREGCVETW